MQNVKTGVYEIRQIVVMFIEVFSVYSKICACKCEQFIISKQ